MDIYKQKYYLYKRKISSILNQLGGVYNIKYLAEGAEGMVFNMDLDADHVIKIIKKPNTRMSASEEDVYTQLTNLHSDNFSSLSAHGTCFNGPISNETLQFCEESGTGLDEYYYQILKKVNGSDIITIFIFWFKDWIENPEKITSESEKLYVEIQKFSIFYFKILKQLVNAFLIAHDRFVFRHNDSSYKNIVIGGTRDDPLPVIIDYGLSSLGEEKYGQCADFCYYIKSFLNGNSFDKVPIEKVFGTEVNYREMQPNCKLVLVKLMENVNMKKIRSMILGCIEYQEMDIPLIKLKEDIDLICESLAMQHT